MTLMGKEGGKGGSFTNDILNFKKLLEFYDSYTVIYFLYFFNY